MRSSRGVLSRHGGVQDELIAAEPSCKAVVREDPRDF